MPTLAWLCRFADTAREIVLRYYDADSCVASTRIGLEVLRYFGVAARPQTVDVMAFTPARFEAFVADQPWEHIGHGVGVVGTDELGVDRWNGHLVLILPTQEPLPVLIDLSVDQLSRPEHDLPIVAPVVAPVDLQVWPHPNQVLADQRAKATIIYKPTNHTGYRQAPDWRHDPNATRVTGEIIRALKEHA